MKQQILTAPHHTHEFTTMMLDSKTHVFNTSVRAFDFALKPQLQTTPDMMIAVYNALKSGPFTYLRPILNYPKTLKELIDFCDTLTLYHLPLANLPQNTPLQKEIFTALSIVNTFISPYHVPSNADIVASYLDLSHPETTFLKEHKIAPYPIEHREPDVISLKYALNIRSEIEACVQEILDQAIHGAVVALPNLSNHIPLIESILMRYGINQPLEDRGVTMAKHHFLAMVHFIHKPSLKTVLPLLDHNVLNLSHSGEILRYIEHFELSFEQLSQPFNHGGTLFADTQARFHNDVLELQAFLLNSQNQTYIDNIVMIYQILQAQTTLNTTPIAKVLESNHDICTPEYFEFLIYLIDAIAVSHTSFDLIHFVDIKKLPAFPVDHLYVLNVTTAHYPSTAKASGILDEHYRGAIKDYPREDTRNAFALDQQARFLHLSKTLTLSYCVSSYEGKGQELSYPIHVYCTQRRINPTAWTLHQVTTRSKKQNRLSPKIAKALYLTDGFLTGSISALELYTNDPLAYFIERGLNIKKPQLLAMDPLHLGTLNHALVEHDVSMHDLLWHQLLENFPRQSKRIALIKDRNDIMMNLNQDYLKTVDANSLFSTISSEASFDEVGLIHPQIRLRGRIDRIDETDLFLRVIDYKSSANTLSVPQIISGSQLQLLTYALVAEKLYRKPVMGVFYYSFKLPNLKHTPLSFSKSKGLIINEPNFLDVWEKEKRLNGWFFITPTDEFVDDSRFKGLRMTKAGLSVGQPYDFEIVRNNLRVIYNDIFNNIINGILDRKDMIMTLSKDTQFKHEKEEVADDNI